VVETFLLLLAEMLSDWPLPRPACWIEIVNEPQTESEFQGVRRCIQRGMPYGDENWMATVSRQFGWNTRYELADDLRTQATNKNLANNLCHLDLVAVTFFIFHSSFKNTTFDNTSYEEDGMYYHECRWVEKIVYLDGTERIVRDRSNPDRRCISEEAFKSALKRVLQTNSK
jgi:hypothetical protein